MNRFVYMMGFVLIATSGTSSLVQADESSNMPISEVIGRENAKVEYLKSANLPDALAALRTIDRDAFPAKIAVENFSIHFTDQCAIVMRVRNDKTNSQFDSGVLEPMLMREAEAVCLERLQMPTKVAQCKLASKSELSFSTVRSEGYAYTCKAIEPTDTQREEIVQLQKRVVDAGIQRQMAFIEAIKSNFAQAKSRTLDARKLFVSEYRRVVGLSDRFVACMKKRNGIDTHLFDMAQSVETRTSCVTMRNDLTGFLKRRHEVESIETFARLQVEEQLYLLSTPVDTRMCEALLAKCEASDGPTSGVGEVIYNTSKRIMNYVNGK